MFGSESPLQLLPVRLVVCEHASLWPMKTGTYRGASDEERFILMVVACEAKSPSMVAPVRASLKFVMLPPAAHSRRSAWLYVPVGPALQKLVPWSSPVAQLRLTLSP